MLSPFTDDVPSQVAHPAGCTLCNETGYCGREAVYEIIEFDQEISGMVRSNTPIQEIRDFIRKRGDYLMSDHAVEKVKRLILPPKDAYEKVLVEERGFEVRRRVKEERQVILGEKEQPLTLAKEGYYEEEAHGKLAEKKIVKRMSILVVEDDKDTQRLLSRLLENEGYEVSIAEDGIDALLHLGKEDFDLILSDINMPNLDGLKLLEMKNQKGIEAPVIFLTAQTSEEVELKVLELGAADYIRKPIHKELLLLSIKKCLSFR